MIGEMDFRQRTGLSFLFGNAYQVGRQHHLSLMSVQRLNSDWGSSAALLVSEIHETNDTLTLTR